MPCYKDYQMFLNATVKIIVKRPRYSTDRITPRAIEIHFLPVKAIIEYKICLLAHESLLSGEPRYIKNLLEPIPISSHRSSTSNRYMIHFCQGKVLKNAPLATVPHVCTTSYRLSCALSMTLLLKKTKNLFNRTSF